MRKTFNAVLILLSLLLIFSTAFSAQKGTLKVKVTDNEGNILPGVKLTLESPAMMGRKTAVTNDRGEAFFANLGPGLYELKSTIMGFQEKVSKEIDISLDRETLVIVDLKPVTIEESITVVATSPAVDATKSVIAEYVTHETVESLPIARDFVGYLQLAAGVNVVPNSGGRDTPQDPAGKGGNNYADRGLQGLQAAGGAKRGSRDNEYFIDSMNITGLQTQTAGMTFNNEVIQEQELLTSGVPAEYSGGKGVVGNIVTKSGGNKFSGSANIYGQPKSFFLPYGGNAYEDSRDRTKLQGYKDNSYDTAATLGGPILRDKLWFFVSGQYRNNASKFNLSQSASATREEVDYGQKRTGLFGKISFKLSSNDTFSFLYFMDDFNTEGSRDLNVIKPRHAITQLKYNVYSAYYQRVFGDNLILDFRYGHYSTTTLIGPRFESAGTPDTLYYVPGTYPAIDQYTFGGPATRTDNWQKRDQISGTLEWYIGNMRIKAGMMYSDEKDKAEQYFYWGENRNSLDPSLTGRTLGELVDLLVWPISEFRDRLVPYLNNNWGATSDFLDTDHNGVVSMAEARAAKFTDMNEHGLYFWRSMDSKVGVNTVRAKRLTGFIMDDWKISDNFTLNAGVRIEDHNYLNSEGGTILHMKPTFLPRLGLVWNIGGTGTHKLSLFYGHFSDPMPFGMIHFAGNISGRVTHEQLWLNGAWYTYRIRGSAENRDAVWTPNTKNGLSKEFSLTHEIDLGQGLVLASQLYYRQDRNIIEDYDMGVYLGSLVGDPIWGQYALTAQDFGYESTPPANVNYYLSNLIGAKRNILGLDLEASKKFADGSMLVAQYSYKDAKGNSQSDGNADMQGDTVEVDPRCPWMYGPTPGSIKHMIKLYGTYRNAFGLKGLDIGTLFYWNSGLIYTESYDFMPGRYSIYMNWPTNDAWTQAATTGQQTAPSYYQLDMKFNYAFKIADFAKLQFFLDIYNVTNNQGGIDVQYAHNDSTWNYQEITEILLPMRFYLGARIVF